LRICCNPNSISVYVSPGFWAGQVRKNLLELAMVLLLHGILTIWFYLLTTQNTPRLRTNFPFRWFRFSLWTWATTALTQAEGEHNWTEGEYAWVYLSRGWAMREQSLSRAWAHNVEPILASCVPRLQFPYRILPGNPFWLPRRISAGADFGSLLPTGTWLAVQPHNLPGIPRPAKGLTATHMVVSLVAASVRRLVSKVMRLRFWSITVTI
jgi:hypothetical protein